VRYTEIQQKQATVWHISTTFAQKPERTELSWGLLQLGGQKTEQQRTQQNQHNTVKIKLCFYWLTVYICLKYYPLANEKGTKIERSMLIRSVST